MVVRVEILQAGRYADYSAAPIINAQDLAAGDVIDYPAQYAKDLIRMGMAQAATEQEPAPEPESRPGPKPQPIALSELPISKRAQGALQAAGIATIPDVAAKQPDELLAIDGVGQKTLDAILEFLKEHIG